MFIKVTRSGSRQYVQLVEAYRDAAGKSRHRTLLSLGRLDRLGNDLDSVISGLLKATGRADILNTSIEFESARALGHVWALNELWHELGFNRMHRIFRKTRHDVDVEAMIRLMVFNRLCDPESKLGILRWLETVSVPGIDTSCIQYQHLLRSMDALEAHQEEADQFMSQLLRPLIDQELSVVFYDMTTLRAQGHSTQADDLRMFGMSKEGIIARQVMLGVVQTADGLPIYHEVFPGNTAEGPTLLPTLETVLARFPTIRRVVLIADRGLLSLDNLEALQSIEVQEGVPLEFVLAVPGRRYREFAEVITPFHEAHCTHVTHEVAGEATWHKLRLIIAHQPDRAKEANVLRRERIATLEQQAAVWSGKLEAQDAGHSVRGRRLSDSGAKARFYYAVKEARLAHILRVDMKEELFSYRIDDKALALAELMDGKLLLVSNVPDQTPQQLIARYKSLADIERGFRVLKSDIEIGPIRHRLPVRIKAHAHICFMALVLYRVMRQRLHAGDQNISPERALDELKKLQHHQIHLNQAARSVSGLSKISQLQQQVFSTLKLKKPAQPHQLPLL